MVVIEWFDRILDIVAPDENIPNETSTELAEGGMLSALYAIVAPDPVYAQQRLANGDGQSSGQKAVPPASAFLSPPAGKDQTQTQCVHCHRLTPVKSPDEPPLIIAAMCQIPSSAAKRTKTKEVQFQQKKEEVAQACRETAECAYFHSEDFETLIYTLISNRFKGDSKPGKKIRTLLKKKPWLLGMRVHRVAGASTEPGFTPFLVAVKANQLDALNIILEANPKVLDDVDVRGRTAFHIAAADGNLDVVQLLVGHIKNKESLGSLIDLDGKTPFGSAKASTMTLAKRNLEELQKILRAKYDLSILGSPPPAMERQDHWPGLSLVHGHTELPGERILLEDTAVYASWKSNKGDQYGIIGVADGHQDNKWVSEFVADNIEYIVSDKIKQFNGDWGALWKDSCLQLDRELKGKNLPGGSTAVLALVTVTEIVVANVGDCRCILIQKRAEQAEGIAAPPEEPTLAEESSLPAQVESAAPVEPVSDSQNDTKQEPEESSPWESVAPTSTEKEAEKEKVPAGASILDGYVVTALSEDHKPDLERERARIEKSGMTVTEVKFQEKNGEDVSIFKVKKSGKDMMAVSRSFGDFDYKANKELSYEEQAIVAVPDIRVHQRDEERDCYLILGCDGVWDVMSNESVAQFVLETVSQCGASGRCQMSTVSDLLAQECLERGSTDNITVVIAALSQTNEKAFGMMNRRALNFS